MLCYGIQDFRLPIMKTRNSLKLGVGLVSLVAAGAAGAATAGASCQPAVGQAVAPAAADTTSPPPPPVVATVAPGVRPAARVSQVFGADGLVDGGAYVEADQIETDDITCPDGTKARNGSIMHAYGNVLMRYKGKIVRADQVTYNSQTQVTTASGHTQTIGDDGSVTFSDQVSYDDSGQQGVGQNVASIGTDQAKVFARRIEQIDANTKRLTDVIYTPCQLCVVNGHTADPTWSIEARQITQRKDKKMVYYDDATVKIHGVPVFYSPYLWTPDPELDRASGLLSPKLSFSRKRGFSYEQPYLWSISPYSQLIVSPQFNAKVNPLLNLEFDRHFYSGELHVRFGYTRDAYFDNRAKRFSDKQDRDYVLADGSFKINDDWRWSFTAQHVNDTSNRVDENPYRIDTAGNVILNANGHPIPNPNYGKVFGDSANFFERYNIDNAFEPVGDLTVDSRELINQFNITRQVDNAYFAINLASFQSLQIAGYDLLGTAYDLRPYVTSSDLFPAIAPQVEAYWSPKSRILGGQLTASFNGIVIQNKLFPSPLISEVDAPLKADGTTGFDTARVSGGLSWYGDMTTKGGVKWGPFIDTRYDYYHESELDAAGDTSNASRALGTIGFNISYPLVRRFKTITAVVEPVGQFAVSPRDQRDPNIPNQDSQSFEFDDTTLFAVNKSPGFDIYEAGARMNLGLRTRLQWDSGLKIETLIGRTLRDRPETQFYRYIAYNAVKKTYTSVPAIPSTPVTGVTYYPFDPNGIGGKSSDWVVDGDFDTGNGFYGYTRFRVDSETSRISQGELGLSVTRKNTIATLRYLFNDVLTDNQILALADPAPGGVLQRFGDNYRDIQLYARHFFTKNWGVSARIDRDLVTDTWRRSQLSVIYRDDCSWFELIYQRNDTLLTNINGKPQSSILFRLNFTTLGSSGSSFDDVR